MYLDHTQIGISSGRFIKRFRYKINATRTLMVVLITTPKYPETKNMRGFGGPSAMKTYFYLCIKQGVVLVGIVLDIRGKLSRMSNNP